MVSERGFLIADKDQMDALLDQMAEDLYADVGSEVHLVGIRRRGVPLMERIRERLERRTDGTVSSGELALKRYADDLSVLHEQPELKEDPELKVRDRSVVLVDDVLYTGRTLWKAGHIVQDAGANRVRTAVLCSRGSNEVPVSASYVGLQLDVCEGNVIEVHIPPYEDEMAIRLFHEEDLSEG